MTTASEYPYSFTQAFEEYYDSFKFLDEVGVKLVQALMSDGPRNVMGAARKLGLPQSTIYYRMKMLEEKCHLQFEPILTWSKLGLKRISTTVYPNVRGEKVAMSKLKSIKFVDKFYRLLTPNLGYLLVWQIPERNVGQLRRFLGEMQQDGLIKDFTFSVLGEMQYCGPSLEWYDLSAKVWVFKWSDVRKRLTESPPIEVEDPSDYTNLCDSLDTFIIEQMQMNSRMPFSDVAKAAKVSVPTVKYRYEKLERAKVLRGHYAHILAFPPEASRLIELKVEFPSSRELGTFAAGLKELPFVVAYQKEVGLENLIARLYLPSSEMASLLDLLTDLAKEDLLTNFSCVEIDTRTAELYTIPTELFQDGHWKFEIPPAIVAPLSLTTK
jgi:DNA-binding Lrp family transcriptional regulator